MSTSQARITRGGSATFTVFSAASGKVYACDVPADIAARWTEPYGGHPEDLLALELLTRGGRFLTRGGSPSCASAERADQDQAAGWAEL